MSNEPSRVFASIRITSQRGGRRRSAVIGLALALFIAVFSSLAVAACSGGGAVPPELVGSSTSAVSTVTSVDASASAPLWSSTTAAGDTDAGNGTTFTSQLTVFQGTFGGTTENGYTQRAAGGSMTAKNGYSNWAHPELGDTHTLTAYSGPITDAYLQESGKFVVASVASTASNNNTDIVLVTTLDGGQTWAGGISFACNFVNTFGGTAACPGYTGVTYHSVVLAVDPEVSPLAGSPFHDVYLYFTTASSGSGLARTIGFYEFYVDGNGVVHQEQAGELQSPASQIAALQPLGPWTYADTWNMVVGREKSCIGDGGARTPFVFGVFASTNPFDNGACDTGMSQSTTWTGLLMLNPDTSGSFINYWSDAALTNSEPDCIGKQRNWPGVGLAYDDQDTTTTGGGGSVRIIMSRSTAGGFGQRVYTYDTNPVGCVGVGSTCSDCCVTADCGGTNPGYTTPQVCDLNGAIVDCDTSPCNGPRTACPQVHADAILPQIAYNNHATTPYLSEVWYDNRNGTGTPKSFGAIRGTSGATQYAAGLSVTTTQILPYDAEGNTSADSNQCIGFAVRNEDATEFYGASTGLATIYDWQYQN